MKLRTRVRSNSAQVTAAMREAATRAVTEVAESALAEIRAGGEEPYEEGTLSRSAEVVSIPAEMAAAITYNTPYAVKQHEDPTLKHPRQGRHHWLERHMVDNSQRYFQHIADTMREATR